MSLTWHTFASMFWEVANITKACSSNDKTETKWQKANNNSTNYEHSCFKRLVLSVKSFHFLLGQLLSFNLFLLKTCFSIHNEVGEGNEKNTRKDEKARLTRAIFRTLKTPLIKARIQATNTALFIFLTATSLSRVTNIK